MNPELIHHLRSLTRMIYFVTEEEDRFLVKLRETLKKHETRVMVYNAITGLVPIAQLINDWQTRQQEESAEKSIHDALTKVYKDNPRDSENFYIFTDPERWLTDAQVQRRILNIMHQLHADIRTIKILIFVGQRKVVPEKLARYMHVVQDKGLTDEEITNLVTGACDNLKTTAPADAVSLFRGLTTYEVSASIAQSIIATKKDPENPKRIDPTFIRNYKRNQLIKTDLVQYADTTGFSFDQVGGAQRFKKWAEKTKSAWTKKGQDFGLHPPKGVLLVGVHGCGKSLSVKGLGHAWGLPVVQLEMGRLRSSGVGDSEANVYRALRMVESVSPCIMWIDEAEKSLSGGQSSAQSDAGTTSRTLGILSTWVQETNAPVCIVMTANSLKTMPVEMVNRMNQRFFFDIPSEEDRLDILKIHIKKVNQDPSKFDLAELAECADYLVGREIEQAIEDAMTESFHQNKPALDQAILAKELKTKPRIVRTMQDEIKEILDWVGYDPIADDGVRARFASNHRSESFRLVGSDAAPDETPDETKD